MTQTTLINDIYGLVGSKGEITDFNVDGKNIGLVRATTGPGGGVELSAGGVTLGTPVVAVTSPGGEITDLNVDGQDIGLVRAVTGPGGGIGLTAGGSALSVFQDALRFAFPMLFESGSTPARDSSGRGTQIVISDSEPWESGWLKGAETNTRQISASAMGINLAIDSFVLSFVYRGAAGLTSTLLGTASSGAFSSSVGYGFFLVIAADKIGARIRCAEGGTLSFDGAATVQDGEPHTVQLVWNAQTKTGTLHVDGVIDASGVAADADVSAPVTGPMQISGAASDNGNAGHRFAGVQMFVFKQDTLPSSVDDLLIKLATRPREIPVNFL